ncbi:MAG: carboxypeptidase M32 [Rickettsiales bacterium]
MEKKKPYFILEEIFEKVSHLQSAQSLLHWDSETYMPSSAASDRADEIATLSSVVDAVVADKGVAALLEDAEGDAGNLRPAQKRNLELMRRKWKEYASSPSRLRTELARKGAECCFIWRDAKKEGDFNKVLPHLKEIVRLVREKAAAKSKFLLCTPYESLVDSYDPGRRQGDLDALFRSFKETLPQLIADVIAHQEKQDKIKAFKLTVPAAKQHEFVCQLIKHTGFSDAVGRIDVSAHPFCAGNRNNVRITARYAEDDVLSGIMAAMHESGHASYQQGLPTAMPHQPVCEDMGMSIHESQSLFVEMQLCRTKPFMRYLSKAIKAHTGSRSKALEDDQLYRHVTQVTPGFIRVDADEVTYPAHVLIRYYIERYLISGDMEVEDVPDAWAQGYEKFFGIKPDNHTVGCLQDIHWMDGTFGYFPCYAIGAIYAAQLGAKAREDVETLAEDLEKGDFRTARAWLDEHIYSQGSRYYPERLIKEACGEGLNPQLYLSYLREKYAPEE